MNAPGPNDEDRLLQKLRGLRDEALSDDFERKLHLRLSSAGAPTPTLGDTLRRGLPLLWPLSGAVAGVLAYVLMSQIATGPARAPEGLARAPEAAAAVGTSFPVSKVAVLKIEFTVEAAVEDADFQVSLPEGLVFWHDGQPLPERSFAWRQPLFEGSNVVPVAVRGQRPGRYTVSARARMGGVEVVHDVVLEVTQG